MFAECIMLGVVKANNLRAVQTSVEIISVEITSVGITLDHIGSH